MAVKRFYVGCHLFEGVCFLNCVVCRRLLQKENTIEPFLRGRFIVTWPRPTGRQDAGIGGMPTRLCRKLWQMDGLMPTCREKCHAQYPYCRTDPHGNDVGKFYTRATVVIRRRVS